MIKTRKELKFYIAADNMINRGYFSPPITSRIKHLFSPDITMDFLKCMRFLSYYSNKKGLLNKFFTLYYKRLYIRLSLKCGFTIGYNCFGYALLIHHYGTIVCGASNRIGNFASLNTSTCIIENGSIIGDFFYMGTGSVISKKVSLGDNVKVGALSAADFNSVKPFFSKKAEPVMFESVTLMRQKMLDGEIIAGVTSTNPGDTEDIITFRSGVVSPRASMFIADSDVEEETTEIKQLPTTVWIIILVACIVVFLVVGIFVGRCTGKPRATKLQTVSI